jgi:hypothetical protein
MAVSAMLPQVAMFASITEAAVLLAASVSLQTGMTVKLVQLPAQYVSLLLARLQSVRADRKACLKLCLGPNGCQAGSHVGSQRSP